MWKAGEELIYIKPRQAAKRLKAADEENITAYIYGISGSGKTEFVTGYLGNRKYTCLDAGRVTVQELEFAESGRRRIVVIDNLQELAQEESREDELLKEAITALIRREDVWLILCSRGDVPPWLTAVRYQEVFYVIGEKDLLFDEKQTDQYIAQAGMLFTEEQEKLVRNYCNGVPITWNIVNSVYHQMCVSDGEAAQEAPLGEREFSVLVERARSQMWDYLEYHVYDKWDIQIQEFLMEVSIVESFTIPLAEMITGRNDVEQLLDRIRWMGNFMTENHGENTGKNETVYRLRTAMCISMQRRMKRKYSKAQIRSLYENAGLCYQLMGKPLQALAMYQEVGDMERIATILIDNARTAPNSGYYYELKKYYLALPEKKIRTSPELMCGMSMLQSLLLNIQESERWYQELQKYVEEHTGSERRLAKGRLLYLEIGLPHRGSADMVEILKKAYLLVLNKQVNLQEFSVTSNQASQMNGGKDFCEWSKRDRELAKSIGKVVEFVLGKYGKGLVNLALAESLFEKGGDNYEVATLANKGRMQAEAGGKLEQCFVADGMLAWLHIINGKASEGEELLERFYKKAAQEKAERLLPNIETFLIRCALYSGDKTQIAKWMAAAPDEELEFSIYDRFHYMTKVRVYLQNGRNGQAYNLLSKCAYYARMMKRTYIDMEVKLLTAVTQYRMGDTKWDQTLCEALDKTEEYHFVRIITREGAAIRPLLLETSWRPTEIEDDREQTRKNKYFWKQVLDETEKVTHFYPGYLKTGVEEVVLSDTMLKVLKLQADGLSKEQIAKELAMTTANVKYHTQQMYKKLGVSNKAGAVMEAGKRGLL